MADNAERTDPRATARPEPELPRPLWSIRAVALVVGLPLLVVGFLVVMRLVDRTELQSSTFAGPVDRVVVQVARGDIVVVAAPSTSDDVVVESTRHWRFLRPDASAEVDTATGVARIRASCPRIVIVLGTCSVDYVIEVPSGVQVFVRTGEGSVTVQGLEGLVRIITGGGSVTATEMASHETLVESGGGRVDLSFVAAPSRVDVTSAGGAVTVRVPDGPYTVRAGTAASSIEVTVPTDRQAERSIRIDSGSGPVVIAPP